MSWCVWQTIWDGVLLVAIFPIFNKRPGLAPPTSRRTAIQRPRITMVASLRSSINGYQRGFWAVTQLQKRCFLQIFNAAQYLSEVFIMLQGSFKQHVIQVINASSHRCYYLHVPPQPDIKNLRQCRSHTLCTSQLTCQVTLTWCRSCWQAIVRRLTSK